MSNVLSGDYMRRPRVEEAIAQAARCPLVYVLANAGYGKTQSVRAFLHRQDAHVCWIHLTESDNAVSRFWGNLTSAIEAGAPALAAEIHRFGFPDTPARLRRCAAMISKAALSADKLTYIVLDNFHLLVNRQVINFVEHSVYIANPGLRHIIISRREPEINTVPLFAEGLVSVVNEEVLRFTEEEIAEFFHWGQLPPPVGNLSEIHRETQGWPLALGLLAVALRKPDSEPHRTSLRAALNTMRSNLFKFMEREAFTAFPDGIQKLILQLHLLRGLPLEAQREFARDDAAFYDSNPEAAAFLLFDSYTGDYRVHPLYRDFIEAKKELLSEEEKRDVYYWAANWCRRNRFPMDAMDFFAKLEDYDGILNLLLTYPLKFPKDAAQYFLGILENDSGKEDVVSMGLKHEFIPRLLMSLDRCEEAEQYINEAIRLWKNTEYAQFFMCPSYNNLGFLNMHTCAASNRYVFAEHFRRAMEYYERWPSDVRPGPCTCAEIGSFACLAGETAQPGDLDLFLEAARAAVPYISHTMVGLYGGYDDLAACEIAFYRGQIGQARHHAHRAIQNAKANRQHNIEAFAQHYLMNAALAEGDYLTVMELLQQFRGWLGIPEFHNRQLLCDLFTGFLYGQIELTQQAAPWLLSAAAGDVNPGDPAREAIIIIRAKYLIDTKKYHKALDLLARLGYEGPEKRLLFGELARSLLTALARCKSGDTESAVTALGRAWQLSFSGELEMMFIMLGRGMHDLAAAARGREHCVIPDESLRSIELKASGYAKKAAAVAAAYKRDNNIQDGIRLSPRELDILTDLYHGLSRTEIAAARYLSINTVKTVIQMLYSKLGAENNMDAVRIAIEMKLIT